MSKLEKLNIQTIQYEAYRKSRKLSIPYSEALLLVIKEIASTY